MFRSCRVSEPFLIEKEEGYPYYKRERLACNIQKWTDLLRHNCECPFSPWDKELFNGKIVLHYIALARNICSPFAPRQNIFFTPILNKFSTESETMQEKSRDELNSLSFTIYIIALQSCSKLRDQGFIQLGNVHGKQKQKQKTTNVLLCCCFSSLVAHSGKCNNRKPCL